MEQRFYKVRLKNGRVIGPLELDRVKIFIAREKITGLEMARLYPTGDWKDINTYPEIADLLMQKLEGRLQVDVSANAGDDVPQDHDGNTRASDGPGANEPPAPPPGTAGTPALALEDASLSSASEDEPKRTVAMREAPPPDDGERTMMVTADNERTMMVSSPGAGGDAPGSAPSQNQVVTIDSGGNLVSIEGGAGGDLPVPADEPVSTPEVAQEKTAMLTRPVNPATAKTNAILEHKKKIIGLVLASLAFIIVVTENEPPPPPIDDNKPVKIEIPAVRTTQDPMKSEKIYKTGLKSYYEDTVEGYKKAVELFKDASSWDSNNVRALCMLASSYMNLIDVVSRDDTYFNVITRLIEMERAKNVDLAETVIADVELYHILGNPDAAFNRIVEFAKTHEWGMDMIYYLGLSFYLKGQYAEALAQLNKIDSANFFSPKISYLYGMIFEKNSQLDDAVKAYDITIKKSPKHVKARVRLAALYFSKDNFPESGKQADYVIAHKSLASRAELAKAYYYRARMHMVANRDAEALKDLEQAREKTPDDQDVMLDYYTIKAKQGAKVKDASGLAKMFYFMAEGERSSKEGRMDEAFSHFVSAREANDKDPAPLMRIAEIYAKKGDLQSANANLEKATKLQPKNKELQAKFVKTLIQGYEFEEAAKAIATLREIGGDEVLIVRLQGELFLRQEKWQDANGYLKKALGQSNYDSSAYVAYAQLMFKTNNFRESAFYYGLALRFDPFNIEATVGIGKSLAELESLDKGVEYVNNALQMSPYKAALLNGIAEIYLRKGDFNAALKFADNALTTNPDFALAHKTKGESYRELKKRKEALDEFTSYSNLNSLDPVGHIEMHKIHLTPDEKGRLDTAAAKAELLKVSQQYPHYPGINYMLADLFFQTGDMDKALFKAQEEVKSNPSFIPAYVLASMILIKAKQCDEALKLSQMVMQMSPNYSMGVLYSGVANRCKKAFPAAESMINRAIALDPGNPLVWKEAGLLYYDLSQWDKMKMALGKYLELYPDAPDKTEMEDYLKKASGG